MVCRHLQFCGSISIPTKGIPTIQGVTQKCISDTEIKSILQFCHATPRGGHYGSTRTVQKFGVSKALISDQGSHFCSRAMSSLLHKYRVGHRVATTYHLRQIAKLKYSIGK
ncbi:hypothetical protein CR513_28969, partial [Mucuna pruriens]